MRTPRGIAAFVLGLLLACAPSAFGQVTFLDTLGTGGTGNGQFNSPNGLTVAPDGRLLVADTLNNRVQVFTQDSTDVGFAYSSQFGTAGAGNGQFNRPADVAVSAGGTIYVADSSNNRVQFFTPTTTYQGQFGTLGSGSGQLDGPLGVAVSGTSVFVADSGNHRGQVFSATGAYQGQFSAVNAGQPSGIAVAADGTRYLVDGNLSRILAFRLGPQGGSTINFGAGTGYRPWGVSIAPSGDVYTTYTKIPTSESPGTTYGVRIYGANGQLKDEFAYGNLVLSSPSGLTVAPTGQIFVADTGNNRVARFFNPAEWKSGFNTFATPTAGTNQLLGQSLTLNGPMTLNSLTTLTVQSGGSIVVNGGTLNSTGTVGVAGTLTVRAGSTATSTGLVTVQSGGLLNGNGTLTAPVAVSGTIRPGESGPAVLRTGNLTLAAGGSYVFSISQATGAAGVGFSQVAQAGNNSLAINPMSVNSFTIRVTSIGGVSDFEPNTAYSFPIAAFDTMSGFNPAKFAVDTTAFGPSLNGGSFTVSATGGTLFLEYTPVPEPGSLLAAAAFALVAVRRIHRTLRPTRPR